MQYSDIVFEQTRSRVTMSGSFDLDGVNTALAEIDAALERFRANLHGAERASVHKEFLVEARYKSQVWELDTPLPVTRFRTPKDVAALVEAFHTVHDRVYAVRGEQSEPRPETIADAISMVVSGKRVAALFAHSRASGNPTLRCWRKVPLAGTMREPDQSRHGPQTGRPGAPFPQFAGTILSPS
jgi:hypothetical protein